jgi:RNA polymerase sigma-70 factor (ECF subfamily)
MNIPMDDEVLVDGVAHGGQVVAVQPVAMRAPIAVEAAYVAHGRDVHRYVLALTRDPAEAEDITAEVFERALRTWGEPPENALPWLLLTARRLSTDRWRRARRLVVLGGLGRGRPDPSAGERETEFWAWFDAVGRLLTNRQREVLVLRYQRDLSDADIASVMGLSPSGVRSLVARALDVLRNHPEVL